MLPSENKQMLVEAGKKEKFAGTSLDFNIFTNSIFYK
jgi:hypothetical protein